MATYAKFERRTYNGGDFRQLLKLDRDVVQYLWESPAGSFLSSIYVIPVPMIAYHLECPDYKPTVEQITESIKRLESAGWLEYDWKSSVVWLPRQLTIDKPDNKFVVQGMLKKLAELPKTYLRGKCEAALNQIGSATPPSTPPTTQSEAPYPNPEPDPIPKPSKTPPTPSNELPVSQVMPTKEQKAQIAATKRWDARWDALGKGGYLETRKGERAARDEICAVLGHDIPMIEKMIDRFFDDPDDFLIGKLNWHIFKTRINGYREDRKPKEKKDKHGIVPAEEWKGESGPIKI